MEAPTFCSPLRPHDDAISPVAHIESKPIDLESQKSSLLRPDLSGDQSLNEQEPKLANSESEEVYIRKSNKPKFKIGHENVRCESDFVNEADHLESTLTNLESRIDILEFIVHDYQSDVDDLKAQARDLKAEVLGLKAEVLNLKSKVPDHRSQGPNLKTVVIDLKSQVNVLKFEDSGLQVIASDLKSQVHDLKAEFLNLKPRILDLLSPNFNSTMCCLPLEFLILRSQMLWFQRFYKGM